MEHAPALQCLRSFQRTSPSECRHLNAHLCVSLESGNESYSSQLSLLMFACLFSLERCIIRAAGQTERRLSAQSQLSRVTASSIHRSSSPFLPGNTRKSVAFSQRSQNIERRAKLNLLFSFPRLFPPSNACLYAGKVSAFLTALMESFQPIICLFFHPRDSYQKSPWMAHFFFFSGSGASQASLQLTIFPSMTLNC